MNTTSSSIDHRLQVLIYIACIIGFIHFFQEKERKTLNIEAGKGVFFWITGIEEDGLYYSENNEIDKVNIMNSLKLKREEPTLPHTFSVKAGKTYSVERDSTSLLSLSDNHPEAAPFFYQSISVNRANASILTTVPGIGEIIARKIIELRDKKGKIHSIDELIQVDGIGKKKIKIIKKYLMP